MLLILRALFILFGFLFLSAGAQPPGNMKQEPDPGYLEVELMLLADSVFQFTNDWMLQNDREDEFGRRLEQAIRNRSTFEYDFPALRGLCLESLEPALEVQKANDYGLRTFTWRSAFPDSMIHFHTLFQARDSMGNVIVSKRESSKEYSKYEYISRLNGTDRQLYLCLGRGQSSAAFVFQTIEIIEVKERSVVDVTDDFLGNNSCKFYVVPSSHSGKEKVPSIMFDDGNQTLYCPEMMSAASADRNDWTGRIIKLHFNQNKFEVINR